MRHSTCVTTWSSVVPSDSYAVQEPTLLRCVYFGLQDFTYCDAVILEGALGVAQLQHHYGSALPVTCFRIIVVRSRAELAAVIAAVQQLPASAFSLPATTELLFVTDNR